MEKNNESMEMYLETIFLLEKTGKIRSIDIANNLNVSKPSVNKAVNSLKEKGYITQEFYGDIHLTDSGRTIANRIYERHQLITNFLINALDISADIAETDACKMEHILSEETIEKMRTYKK